MAVNRLTEDDLKQETMIEASRHVPTYPVEKGLTVACRAEGCQYYFEIGDAEEIGEHVAEAMWDALTKHVERERQYSNDGWTSKVYVRRAVPLEEWTVETR